ncbi:DUF4112 domain-containing protein [Hyphomicrobium sp. CS1GBMeth3]|uniref:DUF4112 domain-containing protein n=1 Tax=Hyphomicrobium sp. CS1GBMeth3 TaxID=1892845 RepID=UPI0009313110|nr:DUF4112 domain-containing protein [Hyphomicrobium sp. CS1GBMeth3]
MKTDTVERYEDPAVAAAVARIEGVSRLMDDLFEIPGTNVRVGLDAIIGLVPIIGDLISQGISSYLIWEARQLGVSRFTLARMIANTAVDTVVGIVPFAGDAFDVMFRANRKNVTLLKAHLEKHGHVRRAGTGAARLSTSRRGGSAERNAVVALLRQALNFASASLEKHCGFFAGSVVARVRLRDE